MNNRAAEVAYLLTHCSRRRGIMTKSCMENTYQVTGHCGHGKLVPPYPPSPTDFTLIALSSLFKMNLAILHDGKPVYASI